jgi:hypothetical protein
VQDKEVGNNNGDGLEEACNRVKWGCSHRGEDGWGCCGGTRDRLEKGGKRGSDCSICGCLMTYINIDVPQFLCVQHNIINHV